MSFPPGQQPPAQWQQQQEQPPQSPAQPPANTGAAAGNVPPPPPPRINNNGHMNNGLRNDGNPNPQFNRGPLNAHGPSGAAGSNPRDPRNSMNINANQPPAAPSGSTATTPTKDPRAAIRNQEVPPKLDNKEADVSVKINSPDPRLAASNKANADDDNKSKITPGKDPRFAKQKSNSPKNANDKGDTKKANEGRMNPLLAASQKQKQQQQNNNNNKRNNNRRSQDNRNQSRRQSGNQFPMHPSRQNQQMNNRSPPPPPPRRNNFRGRGPPQNFNQNQFNNNNNKNFGRGPPPPPPPRPNHIPPPPPPNHLQNNYPQQQQGFRRGPPGNNGPNNMNMNMQKKPIPPPPPPRHQKNNFQGQGPNFQNQRGMNNNNRNFNAPYQIPPPPPPPGSGPGNQNQRPIQNQGQGGFNPNTQNSYPPPIQQQQQQPRYGMQQGQLPNQGNIPFNAQTQQQQAVPNQYPLPGMPPQQQPYGQQQQPPPQNAAQGYPPQNHAQMGPPHMAGNVLPQATHPQQLQSPQTMMQQQVSNTALSQPQQHQIQQPPQKKESDWTEHTAPSGVKYYYNSVTKESTYSKPKDFEGPSTAATTPTKATTNSASKPKWKEYIDASTGKKYYSDGKTTSWTKPDDFVSSESTPVKSPSKKRTSTFIVSSPESSSKPKKSKRKSSISENSPHHPKKEPTYANKEEAIAAFKGLLLAKGISPSMKWSDVFKICSEDYRWSACKTLGERKQALAEYQTKRANEEKEMRRQEIKRAKDAFHQLMTDMLPRLRITPNSRFAECRDKLAKDDRFFAVEDEETREELFYDFVEEMRKREERLNRAKKKAARDAFWAFMKEKEEAGLLTFASTWTSFKSSLDETSASDPRFAVSTCFVDADRQLMFADYVIDLQAAEDEKRRRIRKARLDAEKAQRDAYRGFLRAQAKEGKITIVTRWRNIEEPASKDPTFIPVKEQDDDAPRMIFEDFVDDMKDRYRKDKHFLSRLVSPTKVFPTGILVGKNTEYDEFCENLVKAAGKEHETECKKILNREPVSSVSWFFNELQLRAKNAVAAAYATSPAGYSGRRLSAARMSSAKDESEDEGEIVEDGEVPEEDGKLC